MLFWPLSTLPYIPMRMSSPLNSQQGLPSACLRRCTLTNCSTFPQSISRLMRLFSQTTWFPSLSVKCDPSLAFTTVQPSRSLESWTFIAFSP
jgi:hypothetical protein